MMLVLFESFIIGCCVALAIAWLATAVTVAYKCTKEYPRAVGAVVALWGFIVVLGYVVRELLL